MYVELHSSSAFSFLEGASLPEDLIARAAATEMPALALLDRDGLFGAPRFHLAGKKAGVRAHIGAEVRLEGGIRLPLLVRNRAGYRNLCRFITRMKMEGAPRPAREKDLLPFCEGLVCLTGDDNGPFAHALETGFDKALEAVERLQRIFGPRNVYGELQRHYQRPEESRNQAVIAASRKKGLPLLATNGVRFDTAGRRPVLDVLTCIREKTRIADAGKLLLANSERYLKSPEEMAALFNDYPEAVQNTSELSSRLEFTLADLGYQFPRYPVPQGQTMISFLRDRTEEGARQRYRPYHDKARRQIRRELDLIEKLDLSGYFLIVWDIVRFCREKGILVQGRGSAANSAVCYSLGITAIDPVGMDLLFERFLSEERGEWPDIDLDLPSGDDREQVIQWVYAKYGRFGAAMTANVITYRGRSAAREVGKAMGFAPDTLARLASLVRAFEWQDPSENAESQFKDAGLDIHDFRIRNFLEIYKSVQDLPRHLGQHSGGMVICQGQLDSVVPLQPASMPGRVVVQWDKEDCADMGILKVDLLGLGMMSVLKDTISIIRDRYGEEVDLAHLPQNDPVVYAALREADTVGMFQIESRAQMACLPRLQPANFYDLVVQVAIIRPGPIVGKMVHPYLNRRQGKEAPDCLHPDLEPVLKRTLGVPLFQEQLLRMAMICAGFSGGEAEELRRAFGFKRSEARMQDVEIKLRTGMERCGIIGDQQDKIVRSITSFALYGFPESHAASFALLAYASAFLKCRYLAAFTAALLNNQPMGFYHPATIVKDAQRHGLRFEPIDVNLSEWNCRVEPDGEGKCVRIGFRYVRGLRQSAGLRIVSQREQGAGFTSISDLSRRVPELNKAELKMLAEVGALDTVTAAYRQVGHRRDALWQVERLGRPAGPLLRNLEDSDNACPLLPMTQYDKLAADFRGTSLTLGKHPIALRRQELARKGVKRAIELRMLESGSQVRVAGCVIARQRPGTAKGFVFLSLEDETGIANIIISPSMFEQRRSVVVNSGFLMVEGELQNQEGVRSVKAHRLVNLPFGAGPASHDFH